MSPVYTLLSPYLVVPCRPLIPASRCSRRVQNALSIFAFASLQLLFVTLRRGGLSADRPRWGAFVQRGRQDHAPHLPPGEHHAVGRAATDGLYILGQDLGGR